MKLAANHPAPAFGRKNGGIFNFADVLEQLNKDLYGLDKEKEELLTFLKISQLNDLEFEKILALTGQQGVGKKALIRSLANAIGYRYIHVRIGISDGNLNIPAYGKSKIGEIAGKIIHLMNQNRDHGLVFLLDGIEYLNPTFQNRITNSLKEVLAITHDHALRMNHLEAPLDFKKVLLCGIAADISMISQELLSQLEIIYFNGYADEQKIKIARDWIIPKEAKACGLGLKLDLPEATIYDIIKRYTNEIGLDQLQRLINKLCKRIVFGMAISADEDPPPINPADLPHYIGYPLFETRNARQEDEVGIISTVGRSDGKGVIADLEVLLIENQDANIILTGNMDHLFREVIMVAISYLLYNHSRFEIEKDFNRRYSIHLNMIPAGVLKSGVSAGLSIVIALFSALARRVIPSDVSAVGEITLHGKVKKIIGLHEKILGASRLGLKKIIFPRENIEDIQRIPREICGNLELIGVETVEDAFSHVFNEYPGPSAQV